MSFSQFSKLIKALMFAALMVRKKLLHEANCPGKSFHARAALLKPFSFNPFFQLKKKKKKIKNKK